MTSFNAVVVHRRDEASRGGGIGFGRTLWCILTSGSGLTLFPQLPFFSVSLILRLVVLEVEVWLPLLPEVDLPQLTGQMLADVVRRKGATAGSLDGWGWREFKAFPVSWFDGLARILI